MSMKARRKFQGMTFRFHMAFREKKIAKHSAQMLRRKGYLARVVKIKVSNYSGYAVYMRAKGKRF